jgi:hypothetical protein
MVNNWLEMVKTKSQSGQKLFLNGQGFIKKSSKMEKWKLSSSRDQYFSTYWIHLFESTTSYLGSFSHRACSWLTFRLQSTRVGMFCLVCAKRVRTETNQWNRISRLLGVFTKFRLRISRGLFISTQNNASQNTPGPWPWAWGRKMCANDVITRGPRDGPRCRGEEGKGV